MARRQYARSGREFAVALWLLSAVVPVLLPAFAAAQDAAVDVQARIAAGEFGPALAAAGGANDPALRDKLLGNIVIAQGQAGAGQAALDTAADIRSDLSRKAALGSLAASPTSSAGGKPRGARGGMG